MPIDVVITAAVEGIVDEAVVRRLIRHVGAIPGDVHGKNGKESIRRKINGYNNAARRSPWIVVVDLDRDPDCAPPLRTEWLPNPSPFLCFRIAVREMEAWLLADRQSIASFLGVAVKRIPVDPESLNDPKGTMVDLARQSRRRDIREDMVPRPGSGRSIGPAFSSRLIEFGETRWRPHVAARHSDSLKRAMACLQRLKETCDTAAAQFVA